jgi:Rifampin ADP-ribosyl transferase
MDDNQKMDWDKGSPILPENQFLHGTKADLNIGDLVDIGFFSNYVEGHKANHVYFTKTMEAAIWGAELAVGEGAERIYIVCPNGPYEDDPNVTNKRFAGNPTKSYRSKHAVEVVDEIVEWQRHTAEQLQAMKEGLEKLNSSGKAVLED